jgi:hypothetical protein
MNVDGRPRWAALAVGARSLMNMLVAGLGVNACLLTYG